MWWSSYWCILIALLTLPTGQTFSASHRSPARRQTTTTNHHVVNDLIAQSTQQESKGSDNKYKSVAVASRRRAFLKIFLASAIAATALSPADADAASLFAKDRRQLEVCLVAVWRVVYWADRLATTNLVANSSSSSSSSVSLETRKQAYLEARLAAKAMLTGKIGGGASYQVYTLSTLQLPACLQDLSEEYDQSPSFGETSREFYESIASLVEFDGLDTLTDPSPRSSLTLTQYTTQKENYVRRILSERVVPLGKKIIYNFPTENVALSERYIRQNYADEVFPRPVVAND